MKRSSLISLIACMLLLGSNTSQAQQEAQFSQYMFNGIYINPAYAGYREQLNLHAFYRNQWTGINGAPKTLSMAIDAVANNSNVGLALQVSNDRLGAQRNSSVYASYAYRLKLNEEGSSRLAFGLGIGAVQIAMDGSLFRANDKEADMPVGFQSAIAPDARIGVYYSTDVLFAGFSASNLIPQYININQYAFIPKPHYYLTAGAMVPITTNILLKPSFLIKDDRGGPTSLDLNAFIILQERVWLGGSFRTGIKLYDKSYLQKDLSPSNSVVAAIQVIPNNSLRIGYAYDFSVGATQGYSSGTHEISIGYYFSRKNIRMRSPRYF